MPSALIVGQDEEILLGLAEFFREFGFETELAQNLERAREVMLRKVPDVALIDEHVNGSSSLEVLEDINLSRVMDVFLMSEKRTVESASRAMRFGVSEYFDKPVDRKKLAETLGNLNCSGDGDGDDIRQRIIGESATMQRLLRMIRKVAPSEASVLITGESGVGKELVAQSIHDLSPRAKSSLVAVNCSAIPQELIESQLFGHRKGSFTGATSDHEGFFVKASTGTMFLDEITEMQPDLQAKLLRALETGAVRPVGSESDVRVDCRIVAATNQDPSEAVESGKLREDLFYRLAEFPMRVPPLRERGDDVKLLSRHFLDVQNASTGVEKTLSSSAMEALQLHDWPGNVRELKNAVVHGHLLAGSSIRPEDLPDGMPSAAAPTIGGVPGNATMGRTLAEVEKRHILATLAWCDGNRKKTAETLGIALKTLYNRLKKYGVN